jgi:hypothetical protein
MAVAIEVEECRSGIPARAGERQAALTRDVAERAVAVVAIEHLIAVVGDEQIDVAIVVVVAGADALSPSASADARLVGDVRERAVAAVSIQMARRRRVGRGCARRAPLTRKMSGQPSLS